MFGFLKPAKRISAWRQSYARICQTQRRMFGLTALPFLSYEATFLYQMAADTDVIPALPSDAAECCRLRRLKNPALQSDTAVAEFCAAFGMLLAGIKLQDDVVDHKRWHNRLALWKYGRQIQKANQYLESVSPGLMGQVRRILSQHQRTEVSAALPSIEQYSQLTGDGFALLFGSMATMADGPVQLFESAGRHLGHAIISWDCAVDFNHDQIYGEFNPLRDAAEVDHSLRFCLLELARLGWTLPSSDSVCSQVIHSVAGRVHARLHKTDNHVCRTSLLERWGLVRAQGYQYARCDGCEGLCAIAECSECGCAAASGASEGVACCSGGAANSTFCCDPFCCWWGSGCGPDDPTKKEAARSAEVKSSLYEQYHGRDGVAHGDLNPEGYVMIDQQRLPARADGTLFISKGAPVRVIRTDPLGVTVRISEAARDGE